MDKLPNTKYIVIGFLVINVLILSTQLNFIDLFDLYIIKRIPISRPKEQQKYILYECSGNGLCGGLADRFKGIINAYAWSLFTKRQLIVNISKPCNFINLMVPNRVKWDTDLKHLVKYGHLKVGYTMHIINRMDKPGYRNDLAKMDIVSYKNTRDVIKILTNREWISAYARNKYLNSSIEKLGFKHNEFHFSTAFNIWFNDLFKLHPVVQEKFDVYLKKLKPKNATKSICIQVRIGGSRPNVRRDQKITPRNFSTHYWDFVKETFIKQKLKDGENYRIFVTADTESVEKEAIEVFGSDKVMTIDGVSAHVDRENGYKNNCTRFEKIVMDFYMLGYCDMALVSDSGFGIFGILRNQIPDENFYVLTALSSGLKRHKIFLIKDFIYANPRRY